MSNEKQAGLTAEQFLTGKNMLGEGYKNFFINFPDRSVCLNSLLQEYSDQQTAQLIKERDELKAKHREDILNAFVAGDNRGTGEIPFNAEQYYNQTFNKTLNNYSQK